MKLHRYFGSHADTTLKEKRLRLSSPSSFNDPFEFVHQNVGVLTAFELKTFMDSERGKACLEERGWTKEMIKNSLSNTEFLASEYIKKFPSVDIADSGLCQRVADNHLRICCFTDPDKVKPLDEILLWSHYGDKHHGVRIEFDFDTETVEDRFALYDVIYKNDRVPIDYPSMVFGAEEPENLLDIIITKSTVWRYEAEVRLVCSAPEPTSKEGLPAAGYAQFERSWISGVDLGINCRQETMDRVCTILSDKYPHVVTRRAHRHPTDFAINYEVV
jgi:hypothetical protein